MCWRDGEELFSLRDSRKQLHTTKLVPYEGSACLLFSFSLCCTCPRHFWGVLAHNKFRRRHEALGASQGSSQLRLALVSLPVRFGGLSLLDLRR